MFSDRELNSVLDQVAFGQQRKSSSVNDEGEMDLTEQSTEPQMETGRELRS